jgi:tetratricopeptide (TPR) repeat protein
MLGEKNQKIANMFYKRAFSLQINGDYLQARESYLSSISIFPTAEAFVNLGWTYSKEQNFDEAIKQCHKALVINQNYGMAYSDIGYYLLKSNKIDEAIVWLEEAIIQNDFDGKFFAYFNLGKAYENKGLWQNAIKMYDMSVFLKPGFKLGIKKLLLLSAKMN